MADNYQAIYDAVRSKMSFINGNEIAQDIVKQFDFSYQLEIIKQSFLEVSYELQRPCILFKPKLIKDGNEWCVLYGDNLQEGVAGYGKSPEIAMLEFDKAWKSIL